MLADEDFPVRYSNWLSLTYCITHYLDQVNSLFKIQHPEKLRFIEKNQFKHLLNINDILKKENEQTMILVIDNLNFIG